MTLAIIKEPYKKKQPLYNPQVSDTNNMRMSKI